MSKTPGSGGSRSSRAVGRVLAAGTGHAVGGLEGALVGAAMTDSTIDLAGYAWEAMRQRRQNNVETLLDNTAGALGLDVRELLDAALRDGATAELLHQALTAASDTLNEQKVAALARSLTNGLRDDAALVDEEVLLVRALADLDAVHVKVLAAVAKERRESETWLQREVGLSPETFGAVVTVLERNHLVINDTDVAGQFAHELNPKPGSDLIGQTAWKVTGFGLLAMNRLDPTGTPQCHG